MTIDRYVEDVLRRKKAEDLVRLSIVYSRITYQLDKVIRFKNRLTLEQRRVSFQQLTNNRKKCV